MKCLTLTLLIILIFTFYIQAAEWTSLQKTLAINYAGLIATDLTQSQYWIEYTEDNPRRIDNYLLWEKNKLVAGKTIEQATIMAMAGNFILYKIVDRLDSKYRTLFLISAILIEGKVVYGNHQTMKKLNLEYKINFLNISF